MEETDDFGDLYTDVQVHLSSGFHSMPSFCPLFGEQGKKDEGSNLCSRRKGIDSRSEELFSYDRICENNGSDEQISADKEKVIVCDSKASVSEVGNETQIAKIDYEVKGKSSDRDSFGGIGKTQKFDQELDVIVSSGYIKENGGVFSDSYQCLTVKNGLEKSGKMGEHENEEGEWCVSQASDSDDDLHIVLNEDYKGFPISRGMVCGNGGMVGGEDEEDEDDDLVIVTGPDRSIKDRKWVEHLQLPVEGLEQIASGVERGSTLKGTGNSGVQSHYYLSQYSQFKYVRPNGAAFGSNAGNGGYMKFPLCGKGDSDLNGTSQQMASCSGFISSSSNLGATTLAQNGLDFSLPRNRTILDIGIETFEQKPWRHLGVDITDFFNFGLDEESWKHYCKQLEQFRLQATMQTKIPVYESPRPNQAREVDILHKTVASDMCGEVQVGKEERISSVIENAEKGSRWFEIPKGRAIQVEGGISERLPSIDVRRPRLRDSNVVIQVTLQDAMGDSSVSNKVEVYPMDDSREFENGDAEIEYRHHGLQDFGDACGDAEPADHMDRCIRGDGLSTLALVPPPCLEHLQFGASSRKKTGLHPLKRCSKPRAARDAFPPDHDGHRNDEVSDPGGRDLQGRESVSPEIMVPLEKAQDVRERNKKKPSEAETVMLEAQSEIADQIQPESCSALLGSYSEESKAGIAIDMEKVPKPEKNPSSISPSGLQESVAFKDRQSGDSNRNACKHKPGISDDYQEQNYCSRIRLRSVAEVKVPIDDIEAPPETNRKCRYDRHHRTVSHRRLKENHNHYDFYEREDLSYHQGAEISNSNCSRRFSEKQVRENSYVEHFHDKGDLYFREDLDVRRNWNERDFFLEPRVMAREQERKQREYYFHKRGTAEKGSVQLSPEYFSIYSEKDRYLYQSRRSEWDSDFAQDHRHKEESIRERHVRCVSYCGRKESLDRRERYDCSPPRVDLDNSWRRIEGGGRHGMHSDHWSLHPNNYRKICNPDGRDLHDHSPLRNDVYDPWRSRERGLGFIEEGWLLSSSKEQYVSGHKGHDSSYTQEVPYVYERRSRLERKCVDHGSPHGGKVLEGHHLDRDRNMIIGERSTDSEGSEQAAFRGRELKKFNLIGWEGKFARRCSKDEAPRSLRHHSVDCMIDKDSESFRDPENFYERKEISPRIRKTENNPPISISSKIERVDQYNSGHSCDNSNQTWLDKYPIVQHYEASAVKGEFPMVEPKNKEASATRTKWVSEKTVPISGFDVCRPKIMEKKEESENTREENKVGGLDNDRILETLVKMERRRERFKEPVILKKEPDKSMKPPSPDAVVETAEVKQQRPVRKRRWCNS